MGVAGPAIGAIAAIIGAGTSTALGINNADSAANAAAAQVTSQKQQEAASFQNLTQQEQTQEAQGNALALRNQASGQQANATAQALGRQSTILTSPLGVPGQNSPTGQKTLLGS